MANTWQASTAGAAYATNKFMVDVFNLVTSTRHIRVYRLFYWNNGTTAVTGVLNLMRVFTSSTATVGTALTPVAMNTGNSALNAGTTAGTNRTVTTVSQLRQILTSPDEPTVSTHDWDSVGTLVPFAEVWSHGHGDPNIQPVTLHASEARGLALQSVTQTVGSGDFEALFTDAAS